MKITFNHDFQLGRVLSSQTNRFNFFKFLVPVYKRSKLDCSIFRSFIGQLCYVYCFDIYANHLVFAGQSLKQRNVQCTLAWRWNVEQTWLETTKGFIYDHLVSNLIKLEDSYWLVFSIMQRPYKDVSNKTIKWNKLIQFNSFDYLFLSNFWIFVSNEVMSYFKHFGIFCCHRLLKYR